MLGEALAAASVAVGFLLAIEGAYYLGAVFLSRGPSPAARAVALDPLPLVTVQIAVKNEGEVLAHALDAVAALDWPRDKLEVQVIDDSAIDGWRVSETLVARARAGGLVVEHFRGEPREHKAGALRAGLARAKGNVIALLDADFAPSPSFLRDTVPLLLADDDVACVQARWSSRNARDSWITRAVALGLDAHFVVEQKARAREGALLSFIGTAAVWRRDAIENAGGWSGRTLAEDVDLGTLALLSGGRLLLVDAPTVPQEVPNTVGAFRSQQARWARGSMQCARLHLARVLRARHLSVGVRLETAFHLTHYALHPLIFALFLLQLARPWAASVPLAWSVATLALAIAGPLAMFVATVVRLDGVRGLSRLRDLPVLALVGLGISLSNTRAVLAGLFAGRGEFVVTPKGSARARRAPRWGELVAGVGGGAGAAGLVATGYVFAGLAAGVFAAAFLVVALAE